MFNMSGGKAIVNIWEFPLNICFRASKRYSIISESLYGKPVPVYENTYELETKEKPNRLDLNLILQETLEGQQFTSIELK